MKRWGLFLLRVTMGWLLVLWGIDKLQNVAHAQAVAETYYFGIGTQVMVQQIFGVLETLLGAMVILGRHRRRLYPVMLVVLLFTSIGVWKSIVDPWGWFLDGSNVLFYPSAIIAAGALLLWGTIEEDELALDAIMMPAARTGSSSERS